MLTITQFFLISLLAAIYFIAQQEDTITFRYQRIRLLLFLTTLGLLAYMFAYSNELVEIANKLKSQQ